MKLPNFKILTKKSVMDIPYENDKQYTSENEKLVKEQNEILKDKGFDLSKLYNIHFFESRYTYDSTSDMEIDNAIQCLAIKDGCDLVQYENGNYGFVAYYNGIENGFEILGERKGDE